MPLTRAGSLDPRGGRSYALCQRLLGRPGVRVGAYVTVTGSANAATVGDRLRRAFMLPILIGIVWQYRWGGGL